MYGSATMNILDVFNRPMISIPKCLGDAHVSNTSNLVFGLRSLSRV